MKIKKIGFTKAFALCLCIALAACLVMIGGISPETFSVRTSVAAQTEYDDYVFSLTDDETGYTVKAANRRLTEAIIPDEYNDLPVVEIEDNAFLSCVNLTKVTIPKSVQRVGTGAFMNCRNLKTLYGMSYVSEIGNNAFAMCSSLDGLIIPPRVQNLGSNIIRNVQGTVYSRLSEEKMLSLNEDWNLNSTAEIIYGNDLDCDPIMEGDELIGFSVRPWQNLNYEDATDVVFKCSSEFDGQRYPILEFQDEAFLGCMFGFDPYGSFTIEPDTENIGYDYAIKFGKGVFEATSIECLDIRVNVEIDETSTELFAGGFFESITLPSSFDILPAGTFQNCFELTELKWNNGSEVLTNELPAFITNIGEAAFDSCTALSELFVPDVTYVAKNAFRIWGKEIPQTIHFDCCSPSGWHEGWNSSAGTKITYDFKPITVELDKNGGVGGADSVEVSYGKDMPAVSAPEKVGYDFVGYFDNLGESGKQFYNDDMTSADVWDASVETLYAKWTPKEFTVLLDFCNGNVSNQEIKVRFEELMPSFVGFFERIGYTFDGFYAKENGEGTQYYNANLFGVHVWDIPNDATIYAHWIPVQYTIDYSINGSTLNFNENPNPTTYTIEDEITFVEFEQYGYHITWSQTGIEKGTIGDKEIYGTPTAVVYNISYVLNGGTNNSENPMTYTVDNSVVLKSPTNEYIPFIGWYLDGEKITNLDGITGNITLTAVWNSDYGKYYFSGTESSYNVWLIPHFTLILPEKMTSDSLAISVKVVSTIINSNISLRVVGHEDSAYYMTINISINKSVFDLQLENVIMKAPRGQIAINSGHDTAINLYTNGKVAILGGDGHLTNGFTRPDMNGHFAIYCSALSILSANNLLIKGGDGTHGSIGVLSMFETGDGGDGGVAVYAFMGVVTIYCSNVTICGGTAGDGGDLYLSQPDYIHAHEAGKGGKGAMPVVNGMGTLSVKKHVDATDVYLYMTPDGADGVVKVGINIGGGSTGTPNPPVEPQFPPINPGIIINPDLPVVPPIIIR